MKAYSTPQSDVIELKVKSTLLYGSDGMEEGGEVDILGATDWI